MTTTEERLAVAAIQGLARAMAAHAYNIECAAGHFKNPERRKAKHSEAIAALRDLETDLAALKQAFEYYEGDEA